MSRAMVFLECALFVNKLVSDGSYSATVWMALNKDSQLMFNVTHNIRKWGEAIADKMRVIELKERDILVRLANGKADKPVWLPEEPVFPEEQDNTMTLDDESKSGDNLRTVSYAVKMSACILLLEITRFLRNTPDHFISPVTSVSQIGTPRVSVTNIDRKISTSSMISSEAEISRGATNWPHPFRHGQFGSSLSVEDAEATPFDSRHSVSMEDGVGSSSPKKKRASVYLRVTATGGTSGSVSRTTSIRKQPRFVRVADSSGDHHGNQRSPSLRRPRKSAGNTSAVHSSFYTGGRTRRPSIVPSSTVGSYHPVPPKYRRKSMGSTVVSMEKDIHENELTQSLTSSQHHHLPPPSASKSSQNTFLGSTFGQKLRRSAQRAFRRTNRQTTKRLQSEQAISPGSSPGPSTRKRVVSGRRPSISTGSVAQSLGAVPPPEESRRHFPWLDVFEHIILADLTNSELRVKRAQTCKALTAALNMVYSSTYEETNEREQPKNNKQAQLKMSMSRSLSTLFAQRLTVADVHADLTAGPVRGRVSLASRSISLPSVRRRTVQRFQAVGRHVSAPSEVMAMTSSSPSTLAKFSFANMSCVQFTSTFLGATAPGNNEGGIEMFLEEESSFPRPYLLAELDKQRREYIRTEFLGLLHAPLSVLIHAAPILHDSTFSILKTVVWNLLLDSDPELAKTAGTCTYLHSCVSRAHKNCHMVYSSNVLLCVYVRVHVHIHVRVMCKLVHLVHSLCWQLRSSC